MVDEDNVDEVGECNTSGIPSLIAPFLLAVGGMARCTTGSLPATLMTLSPSIKERLSQQGAKGLKHRPFSHSEPEHGHWFGFATSHIGKTLGQTKKRLLLTLSQRPVNVAIKANFMCRNTVLGSYEERGIVNPRLHHASWKQK